jgi:hypothetical protein
MTYHSIAKITLGALLVTLAGCKDSRLPVEPSASPRREPSAPQNPQDPTTTAEVAAIYVRQSPSFVPGAQRYVLYVDSTFSLQYDSCCDYRGTYSRADSAITFEFNAASLAGPWVATGIVDGDYLGVKYNPVMLFDDFEDGLYIRQ